MHVQSINGISGIKTRLARLIDRADDELCMDQDEWAYRLGWTVERTGFGARRYRNPLFDLQKAERIYAGGDVGENVAA
ncbi:hypothetical protein Ppa06_50870 [Planomonospora parontospora subsp. parontospora]|uniref:Uncharacterized protein n=2 Tax=Planomonospora parontospora TaxID=58119 RepID=A0AA37BJH8_9ACTN|nr:hypothetical protein [Planomonospora parontospora]GGK80034.1 hypothetical protein GCM10010126_44260 [Planomonospora parontospora]GII11289.1 hypothetical protein Ppa06_50870 [Planomonospora parontospora subsp. parontospora]